MFFNPPIKERCKSFGIEWKENLSDYTNEELIEIFSRAADIDSLVLAPLCAEALRRLMKR